MGIPESKAIRLWHSTKRSKWKKNTENWKMSMYSIEKAGLTQVLANCLSHIFGMHDINYEINKNKKRRNNVCLKTKLFDKRDGSPRFFFGLSLFLFGPHIFIVFSTYFICCSYLYSNKITSIQSGTFNDLPNLYDL